MGQRIIYSMEWPRTVFGQYRFLWDIVPPLPQINGRPSIVSTSVTTAHQCVGVQCLQPNFFQAIPAALHTEDGRFMSLSQDYLEASFKWDFPTSDRTIYPDSWVLPRLARAAVIVLGGSVGYEGSQWSFDGKGDWISSQHWASSACTQHWRRRWWIQSPAKAIPSRAAEGAAGEVAQRRHSPLRPRLPQGRRRATRARSNKSCCNSWMVCFKLCMKSRLLSRAGCLKGCISRAAFRWTGLDMGLKISLGR